MNPWAQAVVGVDVGGEGKGFHAVVLRNRAFEVTTSTNPETIAEWCREQKAKIVAVDAPCRWSKSGPSRQAERDLKVGNMKIHCFATPTRAFALAHKKGFFGWVFNGERLYTELASHYPLFDGIRREAHICFESFPHAIVCFLAGKVVPANPKVANRRNALTERGYDHSVLSNIDYVDAALCAVAAEEFRQGNAVQFGSEAEGFIVVPAFDVLNH